MRTSTLVMLLSLTAAPALAHTPRALPPVGEVNVSIGPELEAKAQSLGQSDLDRLAAELKRDVEQRLVRSGRFSQGGVRLNLQIVAAKPSHPTIAQAAPGLDTIRSRSLGGATLRGEEVGPDGARQISFSLYENDIRNERYTSTWSDAERCFEAFARDYAEGRR